MTGLAIADAAERLGLSIDTLRYYEKDDLLLRPVPRASSGHRRYEDDDLRWIELVTRLASAAGKNPVVVQDAPNNWGYVANRVYTAAYREAERVVGEGVATREQVDRLMMDCFRWPTGPFGMSAGAGSGWRSSVS